MEETKKIVVTAVWDSEAKVWIAESKNVPGLITEAENSNSLTVKLRVLIPALLEENCLHGHETLDLSICYRRVDHTSIRVAA